MRRTALAYLVLAFFTIGCSKIPNVAKSASAFDDQHRACLDQAGQWRQVCLAQQYQCVTPFRDAGKTCRDSSECAGECLVDLAVKCTEPGKCADPEIPETGKEVTGVCQRDNDPCGSFLVVRDGRAQPIVHRD